MTHQHSALPFILGEGSLAELPAELAIFVALKRAELPVAPMVIVPALAEEAFYSLNNLPKQLNQAFAAVNVADPDEDDVEEAVPVAQALIRTHYLLDEFIDGFYDAIQAVKVKPSVILRRAGQQGKEAPSGRPALLALKQLWAERWSYPEVMARLQHTQSIAVAAKPVLLHLPIDHLATGDMLPIILPQAKRVEPTIEELQFSSERKIVRVTLAS